jgi:ceramide glucosyltransferase
MDIFRLASLMTFSLTIINILLFTLSLSAVLFYGDAIYAGVAYFHRPYCSDRNFQPAVSILKPICGLDRNAYENLASFCQQDYPNYQIIFAALESEDPAIEVVRKIIHHFPDLDIQLVVGDTCCGLSQYPMGTNRKALNLANAALVAKYDILLIADSDIRVGRDYLQRVVQPLQEENVGVVTCPYRSSAEGWVTILEAIGTATEFHAGVLVSQQLEGIKFAFGSTIVIRKEVLEAIGGFAAIADYLADDYQLGYLPAQAGYKVVLSDYVVEHVLATTTLADSIKRQIRWARGKRVSRPWGYLGLIFTYGIVTSLLFLIATGGSIVGWAVLGITWMMRLAMAYAIGVKILKDSSAKYYLWLVPLHDFISFAIWCYSFVGNTIEWRGRQLKLTKGGKLVPIHNDSAKVLPS